QRFGDYWDKKGWGKIGHQFEDLFHRLKEFSDNEGLENTEVIDGLMKVDYLMHYNQKPRKKWWPESHSKEELNQFRQHMLNRIPELNEHVNQKTAAKHLVVEEFVFDPNEFIKTKQITKGQYLFVVNYDPKLKEKQYYTVTM
ncbi:DUF4080 domain-containing protein, partial [Pseudomonas sp. 2995-1]|uniref:DUF4080 domain-containing protein n=1 Tax=Pseudomonas sp. 2995-1 TaxID=1712679 RepID=UPI000C651395